MLFIPLCYFFLYVIVIISDMIRRHNLPTNSAIEVIKMLIIDEADEMLNKSMLVNI